MRRLDVQFKDEALRRLGAVLGSVALAVAVFGLHGCSHGVAPDAAGPDVGNDGGGMGKPCSVDGDCEDSNPCTKSVCANNGICAYLPRDRDEDRHGDVACGGDDCNDLNPHVNPTAREDCTNGTDDDCNGVADCNDPACPADACGCLHATAEVCDDGVDNDCDGLPDCFDADCLGTGACCGAKEICGNGIDDDCDGLTDCSSPACAKQTECACPASVEICFGLKDEDCDGLIDCADPDCKLFCACTFGGSREICDQFPDEDCDGLANCADPDCAEDPACADCAPEICSNGKDDDCNGKVDCADPACRLDERCPITDELCQNRVDDDRDGAVDCWDSDCAANPACLAQHSTCLSPMTIRTSGSYTGDTTGFVGANASTHCGGGPGEAVFRLVLTVPTAVSLDTIGSAFDAMLYVRQGNCSSGRELACDDDSGNVDKAAKLTFPVLLPGDYFIFVDGFTSTPPADVDQGPYVLNVDLAFQPPEVCGNGKDDDGDRLADCADPDCAKGASCAACDAPKPEFGIEACTNGKDDDCDGKIDCADDDCAANPNYPEECCDGVDQNANGIIDEFACRCASGADCQSGLCYIHTTGACEHGCSDSSTDICSLFVQGSKCSAATSQCEF